MAWCDVLLPQTVTFLRKGCYPLSWCPSEMAHPIFAQIRWLLQNTSANHEQSFPDVLRGTAAFWSTCSKAGFAPHTRAQAAAFLPGLSLSTRLSSTDTFSREEKNTTTVCQNENNDAPCFCLFQFDSGELEVSSTSCPKIGVNVIKWMAQKHIRIWGLWQVSIFLKFFFFPTRLLCI